MKNNSIWEEYLKLNFKGLNKNLKCNVLIIGGGIAGILSSFYLNDSNLKVVLVDRNKLLSGITSKMTAKVTLLQDILTKINKKDLKLYIKSQLDGLELLKNNIKNLNISCDFEENKSYLYTTKRSNIKKIKRLEKVLNRLNIKIKEENIPIKELNSLYSIKTDLSYSINPIKYLNEILNNLNASIYENTNIIKVIKKDNYYYSKTSNNIIIKSKIVIFATNYPYFLKPLFFPIKVRVEKSNISYGKSKYEGLYNLINIDKHVHSIRFYKNKMIYLHNNHYLSHYKIDNDNKLINNVENNWTNMDIITNDYLPIVGKIENNMYIITGFNTWGLLSSHIGSQLISELINNKYNMYKELFNPKKDITIKKVGNSLINIYESMNGYYKGIVNKNKINDCICPHMKCNLLYNKEENTYDCPCHGSRFDLNGKVISGPSKYDVNLTKKI